MTAAKKYPQSSTRPVAALQPVRRLTPAQFESLVALWQAGTEGILIEHQSCRLDHFRRVESYGYATADKPSGHIRPRFKINAAGRQRLLDPMRLLDSQVQV